MKVFISHSSKDELLARELAAELSAIGLEVWDPDEEIEPGDNWALKVGQALEESDLMVVLLTPRAMDSDSLRRNIDHAISTARYKDRLFTVLVGPTVASPADVPWILLRLPHKQIERTSEELRRVAQEIAATFVGA